MPKPQNISSLPADPAVRIEAVKLAKHITKRIVVGVVVTVAVSLISGAIVGLIEGSEEDN